LTDSGERFFLKLRKIWTVRLTTDGFQPSQYTKLCERHFENNQFAVNINIVIHSGLLMILITYRGKRDKSSTNSHR
jgi:hypothetical protein